MSFNDALAELPSLALPQRQLLVRRALELNHQGLSPEEEAIVEERLSQSHRKPQSAVSLETMERRLRARFLKPTQTQNRPNSFECPSTTLRSPTERPS